MNTVIPKGYIYLKSKENLSRTKGFHVNFRPGMSLLRP
jgi:hypothetical protein